MKKTIYNTVYLISISCLTILTFFFVYLSLSIMGKTEDNSDNWFVLFCFAILLFIYIFEIVSLIRSYKKEGVFIRNLLYDAKGVFNTKLVVIINILAALLLAGLIYATLLYLGFEIMFSTFPKTLDLMIISFFLLAIVNIIFIDCFPLIYKKPKRRLE